MEKRLPFHLQLKHERELRGWSQADLAEKVGCDLKTAQRWERGKGLPQPYYRQRLGEIFGKSIEGLGLIPESREEHHEEVSTLSGTPDSQTSIPPQLIWNVPYRRNPFFTGREEI